MIEEFKSFCDPKPSSDSNNEQSKKSGWPFDLEKEQGVIQTEAEHVLVQPTEVTDVQLLLPEKSEVELPVVSGVELPVLPVVSEVELPEKSQAQTIEAGAEDPTESADENKSESTEEQSQAKLVAERNMAKKARDEIAKLEARVQKARVTSIKLDTLDTSAQIRAKGLNESNVRRLQPFIRNINPIVVFKVKQPQSSDGNAKDEVKWYIGDGHHRVEAALQEGLQQIPAKVIEGTLEECKLYNLNVNSKNGKITSGEDILKRLREMLARDEYKNLPDTALAAYLNCTRQTVAKYKRILSNPNTATKRKSDSDDAEKRITKLKKAFLNLLQQDNVQEAVEAVFSANEKFREIVLSLSQRKAS